jgi:hypothetical protein
VKGNRGANMHQDPVRILKVGRVRVTRMQRPDMRIRDVPFDQAIGHSLGHINGWD